MKHFSRPTVLVASFAFVVFAVAVWKGIVIYQNAARLQKTFDDAWADTQKLYRDREAFADKLAAAAASTPNFDQSALVALRTAKSQVDQVSSQGAFTNPAEMAAYDSTQAALTKAIFHVVAVPLRHSEIKVSKDFRNLSSVLMNEQSNLGIVRNRYNEAVEAYDQTISGFPGALYASFFRFKHSLPLPDQQPDGKVIVTTH